MVLPGRRLRGIGPPRRRVLDRGPDRPAELRHAAPASCPEPTCDERTRRDAAVTSLIVVRRCRARAMSQATPGVSSLIAGISTRHGARWSWQAASMDYPVALYLQDAHTISQGIELVQYAESKGFDAVWQADSRLVRDAVVPMAAFGATTESDQDRLRRDRLLDPQPGPPGQHVLDARRPRTGSHDLRTGRVVGPAGRQGRHRPGAPADGDARDRHRRAGPPEQRDGHDGRRLRAPRRRRTRLRVPGAPPEGRADLHRRHRPADDGAHR